jgi:hypothetical protein
MFTPGYRIGAVALMLTLAAGLGVQRVARAGDTGAVIGGIVAGALVYELLNDDDDYCYRGRTRYYSPRYRAGYYYDSPGYYRRDYGPSYELHVYYEDDGCRRARAYAPDGYWYDGGRRAYSYDRGYAARPGCAKKAIRAYRGRSYSPPGRYYR